jgi:hypothetical protein
LFVAAAGVAALGFIPRAGAGGAPANAMNQPNSNVSAQAPSMPGGFVQKDEDAAGGVKSTLVELTQRAVTKDSYDSFYQSFLSDLASRDKARAQEFKGADQQPLNEMIGQIQTQWLAKYGQDFDVSEKNLVFDERTPIIEGEVSDPAVALNNWPVAASASQVYASTSTEQQQSNTKELTLGRPVAIIRFAAGDGLPDISVSLIHQHLTGWYVALPVDRTGEQVYTDLLAHLHFIATRQDRWPTQVDDAYRFVARNVTAALYGVQSIAGTASAQ